MTAEQGMALDISCDVFPGGLSPVHAPTSNTGVAPSAAAFPAAGRLI